MLLQIELLTGIMFSGKTQTLLERLNESKNRGKSVVVFVPNTNTRDKDIIKSHSNFSFSNIAKVDKLANLFSNEKFNEASIVGIDECQFFEKNDAVAFILECEKRSLDKRIIFSGIEFDAFRDSFETTKAIMNYCDKINRIYGFCAECKKNNVPKKAIIHYRTDKSSKEQVFVGGKTEYIPLCRKCYLVKK